MENLQAKLFLLFTQNILNAPLVILMQLHAEDTLQIPLQSNQTSFFPFLKYHNEKDDKVLNL